MKKLNLGIDIDGTVTEANYWLPRANRFFKTKVEPKDVKQYEIHEVLGIKKGMYDEFYNLFGKLLHKEAKARTGASEVLNTLSREHSIHFVTAREEKMRDVSLEWLERHQIPVDSIVLLGSYDKVDEARKLKCDIFIEDSLQNAAMLSEAGFPVLLMDCSYNKGALPKGIIRVNNWYQIGRIVDDISKKDEHLRIAI